MPKTRRPYHQTPTKIRLITPAHEALLAEWRLLLPEDLRGLAFFDEQEAARALGLRRVTLEKKRHLRQPPRFRRFGSTAVRYTALDLAIFALGDPVGSAEPEAPSEGQRRAGQRLAAKRHAAG